MAEYIASMCRRYCEDMIKRDRCVGKYQEIHRKGQCAVITKHEPHGAIIRTRIPQNHDKFMKKVVRGLTLVLREGRGLATQSSLKLRLHKRK